MLLYASKFFLEKILPSVVATVAGAYIVNHYVVSKPGDTPLAAAVSAVVSDKAASNNSESGVRAKGISEKAIAKVPAEKVQPEKAAEKPAEKPPETASLPVETKKHQPAPREKAVAKVTSTPAAPSQTASIPDDQRDANDLARAAIDRLRSTKDAPARVEASRPQEVSRPQQEAGRQPVESTPPRVQEATRSAPQPMQPLPPAIQVSAPAVETFNPDAVRTVENPQSDHRADRARRPIPPADIPEASQPLDLEANAAEPAMRTHTTVADDMVSAAKSVFQAVLPR
ncbi:MAG: hypothetical protein ABI146_04470 [Nitrobacter sp.]